MADNYLITGYWGEPHVTAENDRGINAGIFGTGRFVLPVGEQFKAEYIGNNTIRLYDGKLIDNGAAAGIPAGRYIDLLISNAGQGMKRNDLIVFQYSKDVSTLIETGTFTVVQGAETSGTAADPALTQADLLSDEAVLDQFAMWRVSVSGATISAPVKLFSVFERATSASALQGKVPVQNGGLYINSNTTDEDKDEALKSLKAIGAAVAKTVSSGITLSGYSGFAPSALYFASYTKIGNIVVLGMTFNANITANQDTFCQFQINNVPVPVFSSQTVFGPMFPAVLADINGKPIGRAIVKDSGSGTCWVKCYLDEPLGSGTSKYCNFSAVYLSAE